MKPISWLAAAALCAAGPLAMAQTAQTAPVSPETPAPVMIETQVDLASAPSPQADVHAAREEAVNALAWAKAEGCRSDPSPRECVRRAQDEYHATMARLGLRR
jgi:hypothetical protein